MAPTDIDLNPSLSSDRAGLVLFDTLHGYLPPADEQKAANLEKWGILENMARLVQGAHDAGVTVFYGAADHAGDGADIASRLTDTDMDLNPWDDRERRFMPMHRRGHKGAEIAIEVKPVEGDVMVPKHRWSAFHQTHLDLQLRVRKLNIVILAGGSTDVGIASTAFSARDLDYGLVIARDCCYSHRGDNNDFLMDRIFPRMARVMSTDQIIELMKN
jgi:nicotinamidase-related amidase